MNITGRRLAALFVVLGTAACSSGNATPTPTTPTFPDLIGGNVTGTWTQLGGTRTWTLNQIGFNVAGTSSFSQDNSPYLGAVAGNGTVQGGVGLGVFSFEDYYDRLTTPNCTVDITGNLTVSGNSMTGSYTERDNCNGMRVGQITGTLTMQKK